MKKTAIFAIVEPLSFSLSTSISWVLTSALKAGRTFRLVDKNQAPAGTLLGLAPVLQPIRITISGQSAFFVSMRAVLTVPGNFASGFGTAYSVLDSSGSTLATLTSCGGSRIDNTLPFTLLSPQMPKLSDADVVALQAHVGSLTASLWAAEPINWTTHRLQYSSTGQLMTMSEMNASGLLTGQPVFADGTLSITPGAKPVAVAFQDWHRAGTVTTVGMSDTASDSSCSSDDASTGGTSGDGDIGDGGNLGDGGGVGDGDGAGDGDGDGGDGGS